MYQNIGGDSELFVQLVCLFLDRYQTMLADIRTALADADSIAVERMAHTFKGTAGNLCASEVTLTAGRLEAVGRLNALHDAPLSTRSSSSKSLDSSVSLNPTGRDIGPSPRQPLNSHRRMKTKAMSVPVLRIIDAIEDLQRLSLRLPQAQSTSYGSDMAVHRKRHSPNRPKRASWAESRTENPLN